MRYRGRVVWFNLCAGEGEVIFPKSEFECLHLYFSRINLEAKYLEPMVNDVVEGDLFIHLGSKPTVRISGTLKFISRGGVQVDWANAS